MPTAVQSRRETRVSEPDVTWITKPVHGNSKRLCEIKRHGEDCGQRATLETYAKDEYPVEDMILHCSDRRHIANAHKQITVLVNAL